MSDEPKPLDLKKPLQVSLFVTKTKHKVWCDVIGPVFYDEINKRYGCYTSFKGDEVRHHWFFPYELRNKPQQFKQTIYLCLYQDGSVGYICYKTKETALPQMMNGCVEIREITIEWEIQ